MLNEGYSVDETQKWVDKQWATYRRIGSFYPMAPIPPINYNILNN